MAGSSFFKNVRKFFGPLAIIIPVLALSGCGEGDGPTSIPGTAATPLPDLPPGFCDAINFEILCGSPLPNNFNGGATTIIDNPDPSGINQSDKVAQMQKFPDEVFGGTRFDPLEVPVDYSAGEVFKVKVWSPRPVRVLFKIEETNNGTLGVAKEVSHSGSGAWEELCFDFTGQTVNTIGLTIIFDNGDLGLADTQPGNWTFYYDDITQASSCAGSGADASIVPDVTLYSPNEAGDPPDLVIPDDYTRSHLSGLSRSSIFLTPTIPPMAKSFRSAAAPVTTRTLPKLVSLVLIPGS